MELFLGLGDSGPRAKSCLVIQALGVYESQEFQDLGSEGPLMRLLTRFPSSTLLPFFLGVPLLKPNSRKKGTLIIKGLLGNLVKDQDSKP